MAHRVTAGVDLHAWRYRSGRTDRPENAEQPTNRIAVDQKTRGYYAQDSIELSSATSVLVGWRTERARYSAEDAFDPTAPAFGAGAAPARRETQKQNAWEVGARHALSAPLAVFGRAGRSYRFVNANEIYENDALFNPEFQILRPQHARTYEAGLEWRQAANSARAALFRSDVRDEIHLDVFTTGVANTNLPPSRRQGLELDGRWQALPSLRLKGAYSYTDAKFREGVLPGGPFVIASSISLAGKIVPLVPRHKLSLGLDWNVAAATELSAALTYASEQRLDNDEPNTLAHRIPAYTAVDLKLAQQYRWGRVALTVNNAFGEKYYTYAVRSQFTADRYAVYPLPERAIGITAELRL
jgi:iron complex outermembrane receptor protein